jgi:hypothetical protein
MTFPGLHPMGTLTNRCALEGPLSVDVMLSRTSSYSAALVAQVDRATAS